MPSHEDWLDSLVRITAAPTTDVARDYCGTGFICHQSGDRILILTCRHVVEKITGEESAQAMMADASGGVRGSTPGSAGKVWIEGKYEAVPVFKGPKLDESSNDIDNDIDLAILECKAAELRRRKPLPLRRPAEMDKEPGIVNFRSLVEKGRATPAKAAITYYHLKRHQRTNFELLNEPEGPIVNGHSGSPVIDRQGVFGVVRGVTQDSRSRSQEIVPYIIATFVEQIARHWDQTPPGLIRSDLDPDIGDAQRIQPVDLRLLIAAGAGFDDEIATIQEMIERRLPEASRVEIWYSGSGSKKRLLSFTNTAPPPEPPVSWFNAAVLIASEDLGPGLQEFERTTSKLVRRIYRRANKSSRANSFFQRHGCTTYQSGEFAFVFGRDLKAILAELPEGAPLQDGPRSPQPAGNNPYRGLNSYAETDYKLFHGREKEVSQLCEILARENHGFLAVVGASGSGKSSLIRAGLWRRLDLDGIAGSKRWQRWEVQLSKLPKGQAPLTAVADLLFTQTPVRDGYRYAKELAEALAHSSGLEKLIAMALPKEPPDARLVLFIDQFEELFTLTAEKNQTAFLRFLQDASRQPRVNILITLRADFYPRFLEPELSKLAEGLIHFPLAPAKEQALAAAMFWPAARNGYRFEDDMLFVQILRDADGALPLLSYTLEQLASAAKAGGGVMTWAAYNGIGGVQGVIESQVEAALTDLRSKLTAEAVQNILHDLFSRLITVNEAGQPTKQPADFSPEDGTWTPEAIQLKEALVEKRLLLAGRRGGQPVIEVAHEALLAHWSDLDSWVIQAKEALLLKQSVERSAREWRSRRQDAAGHPARQIQIDRERWRQERINEVRNKLASLPVTARMLSSDAEAFLTPEAWRLIEELKLPIDHDRRDQIGRRLEELNDPRPGVGLDERSLPEILWCRVPGGTVTPDEFLGPRKIQPFYMAQYPITLRQFNAFAESDDYANEEWWSGLPATADERTPYPQTPAILNRPAQFVSWYQAVAFCRWLGRRLGIEVALPNEWEWVQAFTGGRAGHDYPWGKQWNPAKANHRDGVGHLTAVGMYPEGKSPAGVFDLSGNMYEWCLNEYDEPANEAPSSRPRTTRGGAWFAPPPGAGGKLIDVDRQLRVDHRLRDNANGFRDDGRRVAVCMRVICRKPPATARCLHHIGAITLRHHGQMPLSERILEMLFD